MDCNWYILCTKPKLERKVAQSLRELHIQNYCPINKRVQKWGKRQETIYEPLFGSYVFVKASKAQLSTVSLLPGVVQLVHNTRGFIIAPDSEVKSLKEFMKAHQNVRFANTKQNALQALQLAQAYLVDVEGTVIPTKTQLTKVLLPALGVLLYAQEIKKSTSRTKTKVGSVNR
ncbi:UpxY family transcription antiterminator [Nibribacter koreensis]|uniref:NusG-like N-terminal domain-containing protein n=1 Tax=Nibribacter koreensis TaxID=1084519 RepID=A0ABP8FJE5_9BACT